MIKSSGSAGVPKDLFTAEQVDEEIRRAVSQAMAEATISLKRNAADPNLESIIKTYKEQIVELQSSNDNFTKLHSAITSDNGKLKEDLNKLKQELVDAVELKQQLAVLEQSLAGKEELIETLKTRPAIINGEVVSADLVDPDRPQMEEVFVDPLEDGAGNGLKSSITARELTSNVKEGEMNSKVNKLKDLLGNKLPKNI
jgi:small-conductance mechanosensitive channel